MVGHRPAVYGQSRPGKKPALDLKRQIEVALQGALLRRGEVVETVSAERVGEQPVALNVFMTGLANTEHAGLHSLQCRVHFAKQSCDVFRVRDAGQRRLEPLPPGQQLLAQGSVPDGAG